MGGFLSIKVIAQAERIVRHLPSEPPGGFARSQSVYCALQHPGWIENGVGWQPFPVEEMSS
jgi:hypothetical protein